MKEIKFICFNFYINDCTEESIKHIKLIDLYKKFKIPV